MRNKKINRPAIFFLTVFSLITACQPQNSLTNQPVFLNTDKQVSKTRIKGKAEFPALSERKQFNIKATLSDVSSFSTVSIIYPPDHPTLANRTIANGLTDANGNFILNPDAAFSPANNEIFILEAGKRIGGAGHDNMTICTYIMWNGNSWDSITTSGVLINSKTTALSIIARYNTATISASDTINKIQDGIPQTINTNVTSQTILDVETLVNIVLNNNYDPVQYIGFQNNNYLIVNPQPITSLASRLIYKVQETAGAVMYQKNSEPGNIDSASVLRSAPSGGYFLLDFCLLSPDKKKVFFTSGGPGSNLSVYNLETSVLTDNLFAPGGTVTSVFARQWSSDSSKILFTGKENGVDNAYTINADGTGLNKITTNTDSTKSIEFIAWTETKLIYKVQETAGAVIYVKNSVPGNIDPAVVIRSAPSGGYFALNFCLLSPDKKKVFFTSGGPGSNLSVYNLETSVLTDNLFAPGGTVTSVFARQWSSDSSKILFTGKENGVDNAYTINADGTGLNKITTNTDSTKSIEFIAWTETKLIYKVQESTAVIYVKNSVPGNIDPAVVIRSAPSGGYFALNFCLLSPDKKKVFFTSGGPGSNLSVYNLETSVLTDNLFAPGGTVTSVFARQWSSNSGKIIFTGKENGVDNAYTINADGTGLNKITTNTDSTKSIEFIAFR